MDNAQSLPIWRVYVLQPLQFRQRKQTIMIYRVGAVTEADAIQKVQADIVDEWPHKNMQIVECRLFSAYGAVTCDGALHQTPSEVLRNFGDKDIYGNKIFD